MTHSDTQRIGCFRTNQNQKNAWMQEGFVGSDATARIPPYWRAPRCRRCFSKARISGEDIFFFNGTRHAICGWLAAVCVAAACMISGPAPAVERAPMQPEKTQVRGKPKGYGYEWLPGPMLAEGLCWQMRIDSQGVRLGKNTLFYGEKSIYTPHFFDIGAVSVVQTSYELDGAKLVRASLEPADMTGDWTHMAIKLEVEDEGEDGSDGGGEKFMTVTVTRLSPAAVFETDCSELMLFNGKPPARLAFPSNDGAVRVMPAADVGEGEIQIDAGGWLLAWFDGSGTNWLDCPVLAVFGGGDSVALGPCNEDGLRLDAPSGITWAMMPLFGEHQPAVADGGGPAQTGRKSKGPGRIDLAAPVPPTSEWARELPDIVKARCEQWSERLGAVPLSVEEKGVFDAKTGAWRLDGKVTASIALRPDAQPVAPVPPMVALAARMGMKINFSPGVEDTGLITPFGPYRCARGAAYGFEIPELGRYILEPEPPAAGAGAPAELTAAFNAEIDKALDAGILAPWFCIVNSASQFYVRSFARDSHRFHWDNPRENLYFLCRIARAADPDRAKKLLELATKWADAYMGRDFQTLADGARREGGNTYPYVAGDRNLYPADKMPNHERSFHGVMKLRSVEDAYYLAEYFRAAGIAPEAGALDFFKPYAARLDWASCGFASWPGRVNPPINSVFFGSDREYGAGGVGEINCLFAGAIGQVRLARMAGDSAAEADAWDAFARAAIARYACETMTVYLYAEKLLAPAGVCNLRDGFTLLRHFDRNGPADDPMVVQRMDSSGVTMFENEHHFWQMPRLVAYWKMVPELGRFLRENCKPRVEAYLRIIEGCLPDWYTVMADCKWAGEQYCLMPDDSHQLFLAHAWILDAPPDALWKYADLPWVGRGDWFYINKLAETIGAYGRQRK